MSSDKRTWKCPECGSTVELSIFQLDPLACDACLAKRKSGGTSSPSSNSQTTATSAANQLGNPAGLLKVAAGLLVGLILGMPIGFIAGRLTAPAPAVSSSAASSRSTTAQDHKVVELESADDGPDESTRPGPDYKWVRGYTRKDGTKVKGHWAKDSSKKR